MHRHWILGLAVLSVLVIVCDMFQYVAMTSMAGEALTRAEAAEPQAAKYNDKLFAYKAQKILYFAKFIILALGFALLLFIFVRLFMA